MAFHVATVAAPAKGEADWHFGTVSRWGAAVSILVARQFGITTIYAQPGGGTTQHLRGDAADFMVTNYTKAQRPARLKTMREWVRTIADTAQVEQIIADAMIWTHTRNAEGWRVYAPAGVDPTDDSAMHRNHMHLTFRTQQPDPDQKDLRVYTPPVYPFPTSGVTDPWLQKAPAGPYVTTLGWMLLAAGADNDYQPGPGWSTADEKRLDAFRKVNGIPLGGTPGPTSWGLLMSGKGKPIDHVGATT